MRSFKHLLLRCSLEEIQLRAETAFKKYPDYRIVEIRQLEDDLFDLVIEKCWPNKENGEEE